MRIYTRGRKPDLSYGVVQLLVAAFDATPGAIWLVSPWMRDVDLPVSGLGHFASVFGGHRDRVSLSELLARLAARHRLALVLKPPGELVPLSDIRRLVNVLEARASILDEEGIHDYDAVDQAVETLNAEAKALTTSVVQHAETMRIAWQLRDAGADLYFLNHLHAKLLWTEAGSLLGSANFTNGGFSMNEELMVEVTTPKEHEAIKNVALEFEGRSTSAQTYSLEPTLQRAGIRVSEFRGWERRLASFDQEAVCEVLRQLNTFIR